MSVINSKGRVTLDFPTSIPYFPKHYLPLIITLLCNQGVTKNQMKRELSDRLLKSLPAGEVEMWDTKLTGFGVRVGRKGGITFFAMRRRRGSHKLGAVRIKIGRYGVWSLADARARARLLLQALDTGIDLREREAE